MRTYTKKINEMIEKMPLRTKLGQLIISRPLSRNVKTLKEMISRGEIGGVYFSRGAATVEQIEEYRTLSPYPLFIAQDLELGQTVSGPSWPHAMAVSAAGSLEDAYLWAFCHGKQARSFGVNAAFGPVFDLALNPLASNTGIRSLGSDPELVADYCVQFIRGYKDAGILPFAKHFPGFGRAEGDPHIHPAVVDCDLETLMNVEWLPYKKAISEGLPGIMSGHVMLPQIDSEISTTSKKIVDILRKDLGFNGLLMTDSLGMHGVLTHDNSKYLYEKVFLSGHDIILANHYLPDNICLDCLEEAVNAGRLPIELVEYKLRRVLEAKLRLEDHQTLPWDAEENDKLYNRIALASPTYYRNDKREFAPFKPSEKDLCLVFDIKHGGIDGELESLNPNMQSICENISSNFPHIDILTSPTAPNPSELREILEKSLAYENILVIVKTGYNIYTATGGLTPQAQAAVRALSPKIRTLVILGTPLALNPIRNYVEQALFIYDTVRIPIGDILSGKLKPTGNLTSDVTL